MTYYLVFAYLIILGIDLAFVTNRRFSATASLSNFFLILILYISGLFLNMRIGLTAFLGLVTVFTIWLLISPEPNTLKIADKKSLFEVIKDPALYVYAVMGIVLGVVMRFYMPYYDTDEFSHWALVVKNMYSYDNFGNIGFTTTMFNRYEPASAVFMYAFQAFNPEFINGYMYAAFDLLMVSLILPVMGIFKNRNSLLSVLVFVLSFAAPLIVKGGVYSNLGVDDMLGALGAYIFFTYIVDKGRTDGWTFIMIGLAAFTVTLVKSSGIVFAIFGVILTLIYALTIGIKDFKSFFKHKWNILLLLIPVILLASAKLSWSWYNNYYETRAGWNASEMTLPNILGWMASPNEYQSTVTALWVQRYFICEPGFLWGSFLRLPAVLKYVLIIAFSLILALKYKSKSFGIASSITMIIMSLGYAFVLLLMYLFSFAYSEGYVLNCYERYTGSLTLTILLIFICQYAEAFLVPYSDNHSGTIKIKTGKKEKSIKLSFRLTIVLFTVAAVIGIIVGTPLSVAHNRKATAEDSYYMEIANRVPGDGTLYAVFMEPHDTTQGNIEMDYLKMRYYMTPRQCSGFQEGGSYKDGRESGGSWTGNLFSMEMSAEDFEKDVLLYDFFYLAQTNEDFEIKFGSFFKSEIREDTMYIISKQEGSLSLKEMK